MQRYDSVNQREVMRHARHWTRDSHQLRWMALAGHRPTREAHEARAERRPP
jgi:hypothetical protein